MSLKAGKREEIKQALLEKIYNNETVAAAGAGKELGISRQTLYSYLYALENEGKITAIKRNNRKKYALTQKTDVFEFRLSGLEEDIVWRQNIYPVLDKLADNVLKVCNYGFTEILNNAIDHSESEHVSVTISQSPVSVRILIADYGVGIFQKIQAAFALPDPRYSIPELVKGKLTTDPDRHTGEGVFFTSRMFDKFFISSGGLIFSSGSKARADILPGSGDQYEHGTVVSMEIGKTSGTVLSEVFARYAEADGCGFSKTYIPVRLVDYEGALLGSRSQAKRLTVRFEKFKEVILDFEGVEEVGQAFTDELFRVFAVKNPQVELLPISMNDNVEKTVCRARSRS